MYKQVEFVKSMKYRFGKWVWRAFWGRLYEFYFFKRDILRKVFL